jgi:excisionase family DNA binding protein
MRPAALPQGAEAPAVDTDGHSPPGGLVDASWVASYLAVKRSTVFDWAESGRLPCIRLGRRLRFRVAAVEAWIKANESPELGRRDGARRPKLDTDREHSGGLP